MRVGDQCPAPTSQSSCRLRKEWGPQKNDLGRALMGLVSMVGILANTFGKGAKGPLAENRKIPS